MSEYVVTDTELTAVANAIRTKGGTSESLEWTEGFISAINAISGGGEAQNNAWGKPPIYESDDWRDLKDYIESSGTQWIDTGYLVKDNSRFEIIANINYTNSIWASLIGTRAGAGSTTSYKCCYIFIKKNGAATAECNWGTNGIDVTYPGYMTKYYGFKTKYYFEKNGIAFNNADDIRCDGGLITGGTVTDQYSLYLLNLNQSGSEYGADTRCSAKLYRFRIYEGSTLVHEFVPHKDANDVVCLKDTVTGNIKYNAGTGVFTFGTDS